MSDTGNYVRIFDTTLRDGEQSPGISLNAQEKLEIARQLERLGVDIIEAGFAISSPGEVEGIGLVAKHVRGCTIASLNRTQQADIDASWEALKHAERPRFHVFIATSDLHMEHKLRMTPEQVLEQTREGVAYARSKVADVEFSCEDATRSRPEFMAEVVRTALAAGATTINIPDTVGYTTPDEYREILATLYANVPELHEAVLSVHTHNDLGLATANSLAGVQAGARQVEVAVNGIGERAGNSALEEIVMALRTRHALYGFETGVETREIARTSRLVSRLTGYPVQPNKAIVGKNAFAHEAGIHQDGVLKHRRTYEIMDAESIGLAHNELVLGKHSGRHALQKAYADMGYTVEGDDLKRAFARFKEIADRKKTVSMLDLEALLDDQSRDTAERWTLERLALTTATGETSHADVVVREGEQTHAASAEGDGPIDAAFNALNAIVATPATLREFNVNAVTGGNDALGDVRVVLEHEGRTYTGQSVAPDITEAAAEAFLRAAALVAAGIPNPMARESV
ncbi:MAG: 2-isopropylmalate synthase [Actinomycetota bacterium]